MWALNIAVLETVERMLRELDVAEHIRLRVRRREEARRRLASITAQRLRARTRAITELPHRR